MLYHPSFVNWVLWLRNTVDALTCLRESDVFSSHNELQTEPDCVVKARFEMSESLEIYLQSGCSNYCMAGKVTWLNVDQQRQSGQSHHDKTTTIQRITINSNHRGEMLSSTLNTSIYVRDQIELSHCLAADSLAARVWPISAQSQTGNSLSRDNPAYRQLEPNSSSVQESKMCSTKY